MNKLSVLIVAGIAPALLASTAPAAPPTPMEAPRAATEDAQGTRIVLLGTAGGPSLRRNRSQPATLLVVNGRLYLIDCGAGTVRQLKKAGFQPADVGRVFLTHLHYDHVGDAASLMLFNWVEGTRQPIQFYGPPGTAQLIEGARGFLAIPEALYSQQLPPHPTIAAMTSTQDAGISGPTVIYEDDLVRVTAIANNHFDTMHVPADLPSLQSYSYRIDTPDRSIVFTGDTGPSAAVAALAKGADTLVSEIIHVPSVVQMLKTTNNATDAQLAPAIRHMEEEHLIPEEVGKLAAQAGVKLVVLSHIAPGLDDHYDGLQYTAGVKKHFEGTVVLGKDLDEF